MASPLLLLSSGGGERRLRLRRAASLSLLGALLLLYAAVDVSDVFFDDAARPDPSSSSSEAVAAAARRALAYDASSSGISVRASPPTSDEVAGEYVVKPHVGNAADDELEVRSETRLSPRNAWASSRLSDGHRANNFLYDDDAYWASDPDEPDEDQRVTIDLGGPSSLWKVYVEWGEAYAVDYEIQVAREGDYGRPGGGWTTAVTVSGKGDDEPTWDVLSEDDDHSLQGARYVRIRLLTRAPGASVYAIRHVKVFRKRMIVGEDGAGTSCGVTVAAATTSLLGKHGGTLIQAYEHAAFFHASMTEAQADAMAGDACVFAVEPNYVVRARGRARGRTSGRLGGSAPGIEGGGGEHRNLAIPEFNKIDEDPASETSHSFISPRLSILRLLCPHVVFASISTILSKSY